MNVGYFITNPAVEITGKIVDSSNEPFPIISIKHAGDDLTLFVDEASVKKLQKAIDTLYPPVPVACDTPPPAEVIEAQADAFVERPQMSEFGRHIFDTANAVNRAYLVGMRNASEESL